MKKSKHADRNRKYELHRHFYLILDASDEELVARYKETRRAHPMAMDGLITEGIRKERAILDDLKAQASVIIDTTTLTPRQLRENQ